MSNTQTWPDPDTVFNENVPGQNPTGVYVLDPNTRQATSPGGGTQYTDGAAAPTHPTGTEIVYNNGGTMTAVSAASPLPTQNTGTQPVSGSVTANAGASLNTSALALESGGHLATIDMHTPSLGQAVMANSVPVTIASNQSSVPTANLIGGVAVGVANPYPSADTIRMYCATGFGWRATTGLLAAAANEGAQLWVPNTNAKTITIFSIRVSYTNANSSAQVFWLTAQDTNLTTAGVIKAFLNDGVYSGAALMQSGVNAAPSGIAIDGICTPLSTTTEVLPQNGVLVIPPSVALGIGVYLATTAAGKWCVSFSYTEV